MSATTDTTPYEGHTKAYLAGFIVAMGLFGASAWLASQHMGMMGWEIALFTTINGMADGLRLVGLITTIAPESLLIGAIAVVMSFFLRLYRLAWRMAVAIFGAYFIGFLAKEFIGRARPGEILTDVSLRAHETSMGFPSGHTMMMTILCLLLIPYVTPKWRWLLPIPIILMAWSRIYLGLHAPLDIVGGFALGLAVVCFLRILPQPVKVFFRLD